MNFRFVVFAVCVLMLFTWHGISAMSAIGATLNSDKTSSLHLPLASLDKPVWAATVHAPTDLIPRLLPHWHRDSIQAVYINPQSPFSLHHTLHLSRLANEINAKFVVPAKMDWLDDKNEVASAINADAITPKNVSPQHAIDWCDKFAKRLSSVSYVECKKWHLQETGAHSVQGFPILYKDITRGKQSQAVRVLLIGAIHGDELTSASIVFKWLDKLHHHSHHEFDWKIVPVLNPDGLFPKKPSRTNANGVDLNRNFPTPHWEDEALPYWEKKTGKDPRRFPGKKPLSEPESKWLYEAIHSYQPHVIISVHAPYGVLDLDGPANPPTRFGRLLYNRVGVYPGSLGNYSGIHQGMPVLTIELANALSMPNEEESDKIWQDMLAWIRKNIRAQS